MKRMYVFFLTLIAFNASAQKIDTIWFNKQWKETTLPAEHYYPRTIKPVKEANNIFEVTDHYSDGKVQMQGYFSSIKPEIRNGEFKYYSEKGILTIRNIWVNNIVAETFNYDSTGKQTQHIVTREYLATLSPKEKFEKYGIKAIETQPIFPGGEKAFSDFLAKNIAYPKKALQKNIQGRVLVSATIDELGNLSKIKVIQPSHPFLNEEAVRVGKLLPKKKWTPAQDKGKSVSADFVFPVLFKL